MNLSKRSVLAVLLAASAFAAGCGGEKRAAPVSNGPIAAQAPEWVNKGSGAFAADKVQAFYGVGMVSGVQNRALSVQAADERARAAIAQTLDNYVAVLTKDYMASTTAGAMDKSSEEQHITVTLKGFTKFSLQGAVILDHWRDPSDGTMFSLAKLDMSAVKQTLADAKELDAQVRDFVRGNAEKAFDDLSAAEAKH